MPSISFDRAADHYDKTRAFPPGIAEQVAASAAAELGPGAHVLEVGIGTGRIAKPLLACGVKVTGVDISPKMMRRLIETRPDSAGPLYLAEADAASLPLAAGVFDAVVSVHVFHLVAHWAAALAETRRVLRPQGFFLTGYEWRPPDSPSERLLRRWREIVQSKGQGRALPGARDFEDVKKTLFDLGAAMDEWSVGEWTSTGTLARHLETIEHRTWSYTWDVPDDFFPQCLAELRAWAEREYGPLDSTFTTPRKFVWQKFSWPAAGPDRR